MKHLERKTDVKSISLNCIDIMGKWRVEDKIPIMKYIHMWLEETALEQEAREDAQCYYLLYRRGRLRVGYPLLQWTLPTQTKEIATIRSMPAITTSSSKIQDVTFSHNRCKGIDNLSM